MHGLVTLLPQPHYAQVESIWDALEARFDLRGIRVTPYPHFSWQIGEHYPEAELRAALEEIAARTPPFTATTTGLGLFSGPRPVIFIPVVKSPALTALHRALWERLLPICQGGSPYYSPENWVPHISLAYDDVTPGRLGPVMEYLAFETYNWEMTVDNIAFIYEPAGATGQLTLRCPLRG
jgi:2'-5' RNA ligase